MKKWSPKELRVAWHCWPQGWAGLRCEFGREAREVELALEGKVVVSVCVWGGGGSWWDCWWERGQRAVLVRRFFLRREGRFWMMCGGARRREGIWLRRCL
jgi:hypothetical protein